MNSVLFVGLACLVLIGAGTAWCARYLSSTTTVWGVPRSVVALLLPAFGPPGFAALDALLFHHSLREVSLGFSLASVAGLLLASSASVVLGIRSIDARVFRYVLLSVPVLVACVLAISDADITRAEAGGLVTSYSVFIVAAWWIEQWHQSRQPRLSPAWRAMASLGFAGFLLAVVIVMIGSAMLIEVMIRRPDADPLKQTLVGAGAVVQLLVFIWVTLRQRGSDLTTASVAGFLTFNSAIMLGVFGLTAHTKNLDPTAHILTAMAAILIPAVLFPLAIRQTKRLVPLDHPDVSDAQMDNVFAWRNLKRDLSNYQLLGHRNVDGSLVTGMNSGTHWLTVMLATAIAEEHGLELPKYFSFDAAGHLVGIPSALKRRPGLPAIALYHNHPAAPLAWPVVRRLLPLPKQVVLVRDIRDVLVSAYVKWMPSGEASFSDFVRGDPANRRGYLCDVWWYLSYLNRWGDMKACAPEETLIVRYEDLVEDTGFWLRRIAGHYGLDLGDEAINAALAIRDKSAARAKLDPSNLERVFADPDLRATVTFSEEDTRILHGILSRHLRYDYGYDYGLSDVPLIPVLEAHKRRAGAMRAGLVVTKSPA